MWQSIWNKTYKIQNISIIFFYKTPVVFDIIVLNSWKITLLTGRYNPLCKITLYDAKL